MKIVIAPDSFKGSLTAFQAAEAIASGIRQACPHADIILLPLADGGEGTVEALLTATSGQRLTASMTGPLGSPVEAQYGLLGTDGQSAVIEMAAAAGLPLVPLHQRDPRQTTTYGVGELLMLAVNSGVKRIIIGLGGSATNDGGAGAMPMTAPCRVNLAALTWRIWHELMSVAFAFPPLFKSSLPPM